MMGRVTGHGATPGYPITAVGNALRLLLLLRDRQVVRVSEAAETLGVASSTAHRLLAMLVHYEFVQQDPDTRSYVLGPAFLGADAASERWAEVHPGARRLLAAVRRDLDETVHLGVLQGTGLAFLASFESSKALRTGSRVGVTLPAHCTSGGKALLAQLAPTTLAQLYREHDFNRLTSASVASFPQLERQLERFREQGYATNFGESETDVVAVARHLPTARGALRAAVSVSAPASRMPLEQVPEVAAALERAMASL